jgi:hypothetical protein
MSPILANLAIDNDLKNIAKVIEEENDNLMVFAARKFRYSLRQITIELTIKEPRPFNVLEEFIIRAGLEFDPPPTTEELASILALDPVFIQSTVSTLQSLQTLAVKSPITVTSEGRLFYERGTVTQPPYTVQIYAMTDSLEGKLSFYVEYLDDISMTLPDLANFIKIEDKNIDLSILSLERIQQVIIDSGLMFHVPELGKLVTAFKVIPPNQIVWKTVALFLFFDDEQNKLIIQVRSGKNILETASNKMTALLYEGKLALETLFDISTESVDSIRNSEKR